MTHWGHNYNLNIFGFMHEIWKISSANMTSTRLQNYTNMVDCEHGIQEIWSCGCCVVAFTTVVRCLCLRQCTSLSILPKVVFPNIHKFKLHFKPTLKVQLPNWFLFTYPCSLLQKSTTHWISCKYKLVVTRIKWPKLFYLWLFVWPRDMPIKGHEHSPLYL